MMILFNSSGYQVICINIVGKRIIVLIKASKSDPIAQSNSALFNFIRRNTHV